MDLPINPPVEPMLANAVPDIPVADDMTYEPKWDGFRCIVFRDGVEVGLAGQDRTLTWYLPEVIAQVLTQLSEGRAPDGELVAVRGVNRLGSHQHEPTLQ
jgi:ATP-dependent DNA ligase